ncbi:MAG: GAF domain-containing sensor histidine kinase [Chloroflexi bacterium]|nr:GAF domain-containing sensor histidine kinase [Chloroflexota bacterium]
MNDAQVRVQQLERILEISRELTTTVAMAPLLRKIVDTASELTDTEKASILLQDSRTGELRFLTASGTQSKKLANIPVPIEGSIAGTVLSSGEPLIISDARTDPRHFDGVGQKIGEETRALLTVPLKVKDHCIGVLQAMNKRDDIEFSQADVDTLMALGAQAAAAIENARLVEALQKAYKRLGELDKLKSDFISIASHELRTPLSLILLYAAVLQEELGEKAGVQLDAVLRAATRLKGIIETMLNLRYLETGEMDLMTARFDVRAEVQDACEDYDALAETAGLELSADLPDEEMFITADKEKVRVVLGNLLSNAVRFTPAGGRVRVALSSRGKDIEISVVDTGVGIPQEDLERIFEHFYQVEDHLTRRQGGMGLGLSIVKGLVDLHGGRVWAKSVPGRGSRFVIVLPLEVTPTTQMPKKSTGPFLS